MLNGMALITSRSRLLGRVLKQVWPVFVFALVGCGKVKTSITSLKNNLNPVTAKKIKVNLDQISLTFVEGSVAVINVQLNEKRDQDTTVDLSLTGAADVGTRFSAISPASSITIPAGSISRSIVLSSVDDSIYEGSESYVLHVETSDSGVDVVTPKMPITLTDNEAPPAISFSLASQTVLEGVGSGTVTVQLDHASLFAISVPYTVSDGTAVAGSDYTMSSGTVSFAAGETSKTLSFNILDDATVETTETFSVALGTVTGVATLGAHSSHTVSIIDNDSASLFVGSVTVNETAGTATIPVTLSMA